MLQACQQTKLAVCKICANNNKRLISGRLFRRYHDELQEEDKHGKDDGIA